MTFTVYYTDRAQPDSEFIERAWYNENTKVLTLELHGVVYAYESVRPWQYQNLVNASSPGTYYRQNIKGNHEHRGQRLGPVSDLIQVSVAGLAQSVKTPDEVRFGNGGVIRRDGYAHFPLFKADENVISAQDVVPNVVVDATKVAKYSLATNDAAVKAPDTYDYTLQFVLVDNNVEQSQERSHTLKAASLDDAITEMINLADLLGQEIILKGASVRFD